MNAIAKSGRISYHELPSYNALDDYARKKSRTTLDSLNLSPVFKEYQEVAPNTYVRSKPMVFPETLANLKLKEFFGSKDLQKLETMKSHLDQTIGGMLQKKTTINPINYLGQNLLAKQYRNHNERVVLLEKAKQVQKAHSASKKSSKGREKAI